MSNLKHHHHTVARVLLKGFARGKRVRMVRRDGLDREVSVTDAAVGSDFYIFERDGERSDAVEDFFAKQIESQVGTILPRLRGGGQPTDADAPVLARFVAASLLRTAGARHLMDQIDAHTGPLLVLQEAWKREGMTVDDLTEVEVSRWLRIAVDRWSEVEKEQDEVQRSRLRTMIRQCDLFSQRLEGWSWSVLTAEQPVLITADAPVTTYRSDPGRLLPLIPPGSPMLLPLSPTSLLVAEKHPLGRGKVLTRDLARLVNVALARQAHAAVFCHPDVPLPEEVRLLPQPPALAAPAITVGPSEPGTPPTFPARYPEVGDLTAAVLLEALDALDEVQ